MMIKHHILLLLLACLGSSSRTKAQINELSKRGQTATVTDAQQSDVIKRSDDQQTSSAIISVRYRDKLGKLKTVKAKTNKLSLKRKKPRKSAKLRKNKGKNEQQFTILSFIFQES
jgi:ABC-type enterochelin transport system substrate-binding protein